MKKLLKLNYNGTQMKYAMTRAYHTQAQAGLICDISLTNISKYTRGEWLPTKSKHVRAINDYCTKYLGKR